MKKSEKGWSCHEGPVVPEVNKLMDCLFGLNG
jgi:hypothetical protein